jgi:hypothetical protein
MRIMDKHTPYVVVGIILLGLNVVPRLVDSVGTERWFTASVPEPERFSRQMSGTPPNARWVFGYPFTYLFQVGHEFTTKDGSRLFLPAMWQPALKERFSVLAIVGNLALAVAVGILLRMLANRFLSTASPPGQST